MPKIKYIERNFSDSSLALVRTCNTIIADYVAQGFVLTLRQLYYQLVSRDLLQNRQTEYKRLGSIVNDARLAGLIDWNSIEDRTRNLAKLTSWGNPAQIVKACAEQFHVDMWEGQEWRPEVWIEKDALVGVIEGVCRELDVPFLSCRGYTSQSEMWTGAMRLLGHLRKHDGKKARKPQNPIIFHLGDHDPSGRDMTRDISDRLTLFMGGIALKRLALNMDQVRRFKPPPNPAKTTDSRYAAYIAEFGGESWELDALEPAVLAELIRRNVTAMIDQKKWKAQERLCDKGRSQLRKIANGLG